jgi:RHS repeat-associated protein
MKTTMRRLMGALGLMAGLLLGLAAQAGTVTYYHNDLAGSPVVATNAAGQVIWRESYRPYGERTVNSAASSSNKVWFTSRRQDPETGLVYMGARYYDPVVGRFVSTDPVLFDGNKLHSFNRYAYANNNPYKYVDPDGRVPLLLVLVPIFKSAAVWGAFGFGATAAADAASQYAASGQIHAGGAAQEGLNAVPAWALGGALGEALAIARGFGAGAKGGLSTAEMSGILRDAASGKGNLGIGKASAAESEALGKAWVGEGYRTAKDGSTLVSADGLRVYRGPSAKPNSPYATTGVQSNFEQKLAEGGRPISNGHLDITP